MFQAKTWISIVLRRGLFVFNDFSREVVVRFVVFGRIVDQHSVNFLFIKRKCGTHVLYIGFILGVPRLITLRYSPLIVLVSNSYIVYEKHGFGFLSQCTKVNGVISKILFFNILNLYYRKKNYSNTIKFINTIKLITGDWPLNHMYIKWRLV
jgi:hypothetical protein